MDPGQVVFEVEARDGAEAASRHLFNLSMLTFALAITPRSMSPIQTATSSQLATAHSPVVLICV
jgi:hypothetical protein